MAVYRIYVEKKPRYAVEGDQLLADLRTSLRIDGINSVRIINRYDVEDITEEDLARSIPVVFSEPPVDDVLDKLPEPGDNERIQMLCKGDRPLVKYAKIYLLGGSISDDDFARIKHYLINAVESRECGYEEYKTLKTEYDVPTEVAVLDGFLKLDKAGLADFVKKYGLAMDNDDIKFCQDYFASEKRDPTITEIRMIDTYWSDHCRHTTFGTIIDNADIKSPYVADTYAEYKLDRKALGRENKPVCLMDIATLAAKKLKKDGILKDLDESEEINACSVKIKVDVDGKDEDWLLMFKNCPDVPTFIRQCALPVLPTRCCR